MNKKISWTADRIIVRESEGMFNYRIPCMHFKLKGDGCIFGIEMRADFARALLPPFTLGRKVERELESNARRLFRDNWKILNGFGYSAPKPTINVYKFYGGLLTGITYPIGLNDTGLDISGNEMSNLERGDKIQYISLRSHNMDFVPQAFFCLGAFIDWERRARYALTKKESNKF